MDEAVPKSTKGKTEDGFNELRNYLNSLCKPERT